MKDDLIRRSDVIDFLNEKLGVCLVGDPEADFVMSMWEFVEKLPAVDAVELPVKPGADLWWVDEDSEGLDIKCDKGAVKGVVVMEGGSFKLVELGAGCPEYNVIEINDDFSLLSRELAQQRREQLLSEQAT